MFLPMKIVWESWVLTTPLKGDQPLDDTCFLCYNNCIKGSRIGGSARLVDPNY